MTPLTRKELNAVQCHVPNCTHGRHDSLLFLHSRCHLNAGSEVAYDPSTGTLTVKCKTCKKLVCVIEVAP